LSSQWDRLLLHCGRWRGSFDTLADDLLPLKRQPSLLTLETAPAGVPLELTLFFWPNDPDPHSDPHQGEPVKTIHQSFHGPDRQLVLFPSGSFNRGSWYLAPMVRVHAEFGFLFRNRRHRLVLFWDGAGRFEHPVLIREHRDGSPADEQPVLNAQSLLGTWHGERSELFSSAGLSEPEISPCRLDLTQKDLEGLRWLPDGGAIRVPDPIHHREPFVIEAWWLAAPDRLERMERVYDANGGWQCSRCLTLERTS